MKVGDYEFEGTVEELAALKRALETEKPSETGSALAYRSHSTAGFVDEEKALEIITRRRLSKEQVLVLTALYRAGDKWVSAADLQKALKYNTSQFAGLMGAFGRRVSFTKEVGNRKFFDQEWDSDRGCNLYRLPESVRMAVKSAALDQIG
jgi:hypothetical protein